MNTEQDNLAALDCLERYIDSKPDGDKHVEIIKETIIAIAAKRQIDENLAMVIVAQGFRNALALVALNNDENVSIDDVVEELPKFINAD